MAYLQARSNIGRAGVTYAGYAPPRFRVYVNSVDKTSSFLKGEWVITDTLDETPSTLRARVRGFTPEVGHPIQVLHCTPNEYLFDGHLLRVTARVQSGQTVQYDLEAQDQSFRIDRTAPHGRRRSLGINTLVREWFGGRGAPLNADFAPGYIASALGNVSDLTFDGSQPITACLTKLAKSVGGYWRLNPGRRTIDIFTPGGDADGNRPGLVNTSTNAWDLVYTRDATQIRTGILAIGSGGSTVSPTATGATSITVTECGWYDPAGGTVYIGGMPNVYTAPSKTSGEGVLGMAGWSTEWGSGDGLSHDVAANEVVRHSYMNTAASVDSWGGALGSITGLQYTNLRAYDLGANAVGSLVEAQLSLYGLPVGTLEYTTDARWVRPGQYVAASVTSPAAVQGTFVIQAVETTPRVATNSVISFQKRVRAGAYTMGLSDLLARLA